MDREFSDVNGTLDYKSCGELLKQSSACNVHLAAIFKLAGWLLHPFLNGRLRGGAFILFYTKRSKQSNEISFGEQNVIIFSIWVFNSIFSFVITVNISHTNTFHIRVPPQIRNKQH